MDLAETRLFKWLSPIVHLSSNWISRIGVVLVTTATVLWLYLLPNIIRGEVSHPYLGMLIFLVLPGVFFRPHSDSDWNHPAAARGAT